MNVCIVHHYEKIHCGNRLIMKTDDIITPPKGIIGTPFDSYRIEISRRRLKYLYCVNRYIYHVKILFLNSMT